MKLVRVTSDLRRVNSRVDATRFHSGFNVNY